MLVDAFQSASVWSASSTTIAHSQAHYIRVQHSLSKTPVITLALHSSEKRRWCHGMLALKECL
jgi:hypothetical protein